MNAYTPIRTLLCRGLAATALLGLAACAAPEALRGDFPATTPKDATAGGTAPGPVRWGGTLLSMSNKNDSSCFEILGRPLDSTGRPKRTDEDLGRFIACAPGFKDPEVYKTGRVVTVIGTVEGSEERKVGEFPYRYPKLAASTVYLWKERSEPSVIYAYDPFFSPYAYPYPYYGGATYYYYKAPEPTPLAPLNAPNGDGGVGGTLQQTLPALPKLRRR